METKSISIFLGHLLINFSIFSLCSGVIQHKADFEMQERSPQSCFFFFLFSSFDLLPRYCFIRSKSLKALTWIAVKISGTRCSLYEHKQMPCHLSHNAYILLDFTITRTMLILYNNHLKEFLKDWAYCVINGTIFLRQTCWNVCIQVSSVL